MADKVKHRICRCAGGLLMSALLLLPTQAQAQGASHSVTTDGITVTIETDKEEYKAGEEVQYSVIVENGRDKWDISASTFTYSNTEGLTAAEEGSMPDSLPEIPSGESHTLTGRLVGAPENFSGSAEGGAAGLAVGVTAAVVAVIAIVAAAVVLLLKKKKGAKVAALFLAAALLAGEGLPAQAAANETITVRPYVNFNYGGQEVVIRAVMELKMEQQLMVIEPEDRKTYQKITCHDPQFLRILTAHIIFLAPSSPEAAHRICTTGPVWMPGFREASARKSGIRSRHGTRMKTRTAGTAISGRRILSIILIWKNTVCI